MCVLNMKTMTMSVAAVCPQEQESAAGWLSECESPLSRWLFFLYIVLSLGSFRGIAPSPPASFSPSLCFCSGWRCYESAVWWSPPPREIVTTFLPQMPATTCNICNVALAGSCADGCWIVFMNVECHFEGNAHLSRLRMECHMYWLVVRGSVTRDIWQQWS